MSLDDLLAEIADAPGLKLLPVSKGHSVKSIQAVLSKRKIPRRLGENYLEELIEKSKQIANMEWHFIGRLQSRKIPDICRIASVIHTVTRRKELEEIAKFVAPKFFVQVNISNEEQKNGCDESELQRLKQNIEGLGLEKRWLGLMGMAAPIEVVGEEEVRKSFAKLRELRDRYCPGKELSMGMSSDYKIAIAEGSNWLRIGSLVFGERA